MSRYMGFLDAGFLRAQGARMIGIRPIVTQFSPEVVVAWFENLAKAGGVLEGDELSRVNWYDGAYDPRDARHGVQRHYLAEIERTPGVTLRLGRLHTRETPALVAMGKELEGRGVDIRDLRSYYTFREIRQQKGVDVLIGLDLVRFGERDEFDAAVLISGDSDLKEAVQLVQEAGKRVLLAYPRRTRSAKELRGLTSELLPIDNDWMESMLYEPTAPRRRPRGPRHAIIRGQSG